MYPAYKIIFNHVSNLQDYIQPCIQPTRLYSTMYPTYKIIFNHVSNLQDYIQPCIQHTRLYSTIYSSHKIKLSVQIEEKNLNFSALEF